MQTFEQYEVVVVSFPFTDRNANKRRPALILSDSSSLTIDKSILAIITSSLHHPWPLDVEIRRFSCSGAEFTLNHKNEAVYFKQFISG